MNRLITLICILNFTLLMSQNNTTTKNNEKYISEKDFVTTDSYTTIMNKTIEIENGEGNLVKVNFSFVVTSEQFKKVNNKLLNKMIKTSNNLTKEQIKNKYTYIPRIINFGYIDFMNEWTISIEFTAQNDFGATKDDKIVTFFTDDGNHKLH